MKPDLSDHELREVIESHYEVRVVSVKPMAGEIDQNAEVVTDESFRFVLKVSAL